MRPNSWARAAAACALAGSIGSAQAGLVDYTVTALGGNAWRYDYTINNPMPSVGFDQATIWFDAGLYEGLALMASPPDWDPIVVQPDIAIPADGFLDVLRLNGAVPGGLSVVGFSVTFTFLGAGAPSAQRFDLLDSATLAVLASGTTSPAGPGAVPAPGPWVLAAIPLLVCAVRASRRRAPTAANRPSEQLLSEV